VVSRFRPAQTKYQLLPQKEFFLLRHPETEGNAQKKLMGGGFNADLSEEGKSQLKSIEELFKVMSAKDSPKHIIHSGMIRTKKPAQIIQKITSLQVTEDSNLREREYGSLQGMPHATLESPEIVSKAIGLEKIEDFYNRVLWAMKSHLSNADSPIFVAHKGTFKALAANYGKNIDVKNGELYHFQPDLSHPSFPWKITKLTLEKGAIRRTGVRLRDFANPLSPM